MMLKNNVGFFYLPVFIASFLFLFFQTKSLCSLFRDTGHHLIQNNKVGGINSPLSKPVVSKSVKEDKVVRKGYERKA